MMNMVLEPGGDYSLGDVIEDGVASRLGDGVATIPFEPQAQQRHPIAGFYYRAFGQRGGAVPEVIPGHVCRGTVYGYHGAGRVHWRARLVVQEEHLELTEGGVWTSKAVGFIRLAGDSAQPHAHAAGVASNEGSGAMAKIDGREVSDSGTMLVGGTSRVTAPIDGYVGLCLYGAARGVRVAWWAASLTE